MASRVRNPAALEQWKEGLRRAKAAFQALPEIVRERTLEARATTASEIARNAQARVVASPSIHTRALLDHIGWSQTKSNGRTRVGVLRAMTTFISAGVKVRIKGIVKANANAAKGWTKVQPTRYAHLVEFGAVHMPAEPFMKPSAEAEKGYYLERIKDAGQDIERDMAAIGGGRL